MQIKKPRVRLRRWLRWLARFAAACALLLIVVVLLWFRSALYHRLWRFPREEAAWQELRAQRVPIPPFPGWTEFKGILHSHSHLSHDSEVPFEEILRVLKATGADFICLSDHCIDGRADFSLQWRGLHDGKLFVPGFEMRDGFMPFGVESSVVLSNRSDSVTLAQAVVAHGGVLFYAHPEEPRDWDRPELTGMEIYNLHSDFKRSKHPLRDLLPDLLLNLGSYPDQLFRETFRRPTEFLARWDELNRTRHITGIAGNDCHQNVGIRAFYTAAGTIRIEDTSPKVLREFTPGWFTRRATRLLCGPLEPNQLLFHVQLDPYERSARFVNTHVLAHELSERAILDALRAGRVFIGFDLMADSSSFQWFATDSVGAAVMGEARPFSNATRLHAESPVPCRFTLVKDGTAVSRREGRLVDWTPSGPGQYRVEAELNVRHEWLPWVYANPIHLVDPER